MAWLDHFREINNKCHTGYNYNIYILVFTADGLLYLVLCCMLKRKVVWRRKKSILLTFHRFYKQTQYVLFVSRGNFESHTNNNIHDFPNGTIVSTNSPMEQQYPRTSQWNNSVNKNNHRKDSIHRLLRTIISTNFPMEQQHPH